MSPAVSVAANLSPTTRKEIGIEALARTIPITHLADKPQVSRKFVYQQSKQVQQALDESFAPSQEDDEVLFHLPVTKNWLFQSILGLVLICHSSYRGVVELLRDLFDTPISIGTVHNRLEAVAVQATAINQAQELSEVRQSLRTYRGARRRCGAAICQSAVRYYLHSRASSCGSRFSGRSRRVAKLSKILDLRDSLGRLRDRPPDIFIERQSGGGQSKRLSSDRYCSLLDASPPHERPLRVRSIYGFVPSSTELLACLL